jgi:hypothetical protein
VGIRVYSKVNIKYFNTLTYDSITKIQCSLILITNTSKISIDFVEKNHSLQKKVASVTLQLDT